MLTTAKNIRYLFFVDNCFAQASKSCLKRFYEFPP
jgi:hypothetical protein